MQNQRKSSKISENTMANQLIRAKLAQKNFSLPLPIQQWILPYRKIIPQAASSKKFWGCFRCDTGDITVIIEVTIS